MGNPIQDAETALDEIINNVQTMRKELEEDFVIPLQRFPKADVDELDMIHDQCIQAVQGSMEKLFGPGPDSFQGAAADAVANRFGEFLERESLFNNYMKSLSRNLPTMSNFSPYSFLLQVLNDGLYQPRKVNGKEAS